MEQIKGTNSSRLPPCQKVLQKKIARANYVAHMCMWKHAATADPTNGIDVLSSGWKLENDKFAVCCMENKCPPQFPRTLRVILMRMLMKMKH